MPPQAPKRPYDQREARLLAEFLDRFFPHDPVIDRVRLGFAPIAPGKAPLDPAERTLLKNFSRWADALVIRPREVILIEAEILPSPGIVSTLQLYGRLFRKDPDYAKFADRVLRLMLVWAFEDLVLAQIAREQNVEVRIFQPEWLQAALRNAFGGELRRKERPTRTPD